MSRIANIIQVKFVLRFALVCVCVGPGVFLAYVSTLLDANSHYLAFFPGIVLCSRFYDALGGTLSAGLSALALWDWFVPPDGFALPDHRDTLHLLAFLAVSLVICWIVRRDNKTRKELIRENVGLSHKVLLLRALRNVSAR